MSKLEAAFSEYGFPDMHFYSFLFSIEDKHKLSIEEPITLISNLYMCPLIIEVIIN